MAIVIGLSDTACVDSAPCARIACGMDQIYPESIRALGTITWGVEFRMHYQGTDFPVEIRASAFEHFEYRGPMNGDALASFIRENPVAAMTLVIHHRIASGVALTDLRRMIFTSGSVEFR